MISFSLWREFSYYLRKAFPNLANRASDKYLSVQCLPCTMCSTDMNTDKMDGGPAQAGQCTVQPVFEMALEVRTAEATLVKAGV